MTEFLRVLALYYACDNAAAVQPLTSEQWRACTAHYEAVKSYFNGATNLDRYRAFKLWETQNGGVVASLRN